MVIHPAWLGRLHLIWAPLTIIYCVVIVLQISCETFCVGEDVSSEAASASLTGQDRSWNSKKFRINICSEDEEQPSLIECKETIMK